MGICLIVKSGGGVDTSTANATASTIVSGYTCYVNDALVTGSMPKQFLTKTLSAGDSQTIAAGYYTENESKISVSTLASLTGGTDIAASQVLNTYTYWSAGAKGTGTMTSRGKKEWKIDVNGSQTIESGWHDGNGTVKQSSTVTTNSTKTTMTPTTSNQTLCNASTYYSQERWCAGASTLVAGNIKKGVSIFGVSGSYYETKRYIIQNGQFVSGVSHDVIQVRSQKGSDGDKWEATITDANFGKSDTYGIWVFHNWNESGFTSYYDYLRFRGWVGYLSWNGSTLNGFIGGDFWISATSSTKPSATGVSISGYFCHTSGTWYTARAVAMTLASGLTISTSGLTKVSVGWSSSMKLGATNAQLASRDTSNEAGNIKLGVNWNSSGSPELAVYAWNLYIDTSHSLTT